MEFIHYSVLLSETVDSLGIRKDGIYVDCTAGGGGHSKRILECLGEKGRLIAIDRDPDAVSVLKKRIGNDKRVTLINDNFSNLEEILKEAGVDKVDGIIADLGVSSFQLDEAERGFSLHNDAPLDMRMSREGISAYDVVNTYDEKDLVRIIRSYGEEKFASSIARNIVRERQKEPIENTLRLADIVKASIPAAARRTGGHPARKTFQAIRIEVNNELEILENTIDKMFDALKTGGRLSIITFHSLEDRIVKKHFASFCEGCVCPKEFPVCVCGRTPRGRLVFKFKTASENELSENNRSRSATLRSVEKIT